MAEYFKEQALPQLLEYGIEFFSVAAHGARWSYNEVIYD